jgi:hypothetical protein
MRKPMTESELKMDVLNNVTMNRTYSEISTPKTRTQIEGDYNRAT